MKPRRYREVVGEFGVASRQAIQVFALIAQGAASR